MDSSWVPNPDRKLVVYVGWPLKVPREWKKAKNYDSNRLELEDGTFVKAGDVQSHLLVYPNNEALGGNNLFYPFPAGVKFLQPKSGPREPLTLDSVQIAYGKAVCKVSHSRFRKDSEGKLIYATTLRKPLIAADKNPKICWIQARRTKVCFEHGYGRLLHGGPIYCLVCGAPRWLDPFGRTGN
jgi:hypothetical protein